MIRRFLLAVFLTALSTLAVTPAFALSTRNPNII